MFHPKAETTVELKPESMDPERDQKLTEQCEQRSAVDESDIEIIVKMLTPNSERLAKVKPEHLRDYHAHILAALNFIRNATSEHYAVEFVLHPKVMNVLTTLALDETTSSDKLGVILDIFINTTSRSHALSQALIENYDMVSFIERLASGNSQHREKTIWLLSNLAGMCPELVHQRLLMKNENYLSTFIDIFTNGKDADVGPYYGQVAVSLSTLEDNRHFLANSHLDKFLPLCGSLNPNRQARVTALSLLRNLAIDTKLHPLLLSKQEFLTAIIEPIMSGDYEFSDEEIEKLPQSLQYYDGTPIVDDDAEACIVDTLYKLCDSRQGRETLRNSGIYCVLREYHKFQKQSKLDDEMGAGSSAMGIFGPAAKSMQVLDQDNPLEALLSVLIRTEEEIGLPSDVNLGDVVMEE